MQCKDCAPGSKRPAPHPGPRCATHHRAVTKDRKTYAHTAMVARTYGLAMGEYERMYEAQDGKCAICKRATGRTKRLAVDHDHKTGFVRGLLCSVCNQYLGYLYDNPEAYMRGAQYLERARMHSLVEGWTTNNKVLTQGAEG